jgi:hypothetical protein
MESTWLNLNGLDLNGHHGQLVMAEPEWTSWSWFSYLYLFMFYFCGLLFSFWMKKCNYANASICIRCNELCKCKCKYLFCLDNI